jgi:hypothetical protein
MTIGSFTLDGTTINVSTDYNSIDGLVYRFVQADTEQEVAATSYRGIDLADGVKYSKVELQRGLETVRRRARR